MRPIEAVLYAWALYFVGCGAGLYVTGGSVYGALLHAISGVGFAAWAAHLGQSRR